MESKESKSSRHFNVSLLKSAFRLTAGYYLFQGDFKMSGILFIVAELLGIAEEL